MSLAGRENLVWDWGYYLTSSRSGNTNIIIFLVDDLFVEVCTNTAEKKTEYVKAVLPEELREEHVKAIIISKPFVKAKLARKEEEILHSAA